MWPGRLCRAANSGGMRPRSSSSCCLACRLGTLALSEGSARACARSDDASFNRGSPCMCWRITELGRGNAKVAAVHSMVLASPCLCQRADAQLGPLRDTSGGPWSRQGYQTLKCGGIRAALRWFL
jgi:hypothetical protein